MNTEEKIANFAKQINNTLVKKIELLKNQESDVQLAVLERYISAIYPHFIPWVAAMQNSCVTSMGKFAANDNIFLELTENHQQMLWDFMIQINIKPNTQAYEKLLPHIDNINEIMISGVKRKIGVGPASIIYFLESASEIFIPWMGEVARNNNATNMIYVEKHGEFDKKHADFAREAIIEEVKIRPENSDEEIRLAALGIGLFFDKIFY
jgi:hypothetical protein